MIGRVDENNRALLDLRISGKRDGQYSLITAWVDTAFDGHLVLPAEAIKKLELAPLVETEAILADGSKVLLETFLCFVEWFEQRVPLQVISNDGRFPLLGTELLSERTLLVDYRRKVVKLD